MLLVDGNQQSWTYRLLDQISPEAPPPPTPAPPPVDQAAWEQSVDSHKVNELTVRQVGLIVFNETQPLSDGENANDTIDSAREKVAHVVINGDETLGVNRPTTAAPIEPSADALRNASVRAAYDSSMRAAREAYLSPTDPTGGATHFNLRGNPSRADFKESGTAIRTHSGPFNNSFPTPKVPSQGVFVNTYAPD